MDAIPTLPTLSHGEGRIAKLEIQGYRILRIIHGSLCGTRKIHVEAVKASEFAALNHRGTELLPLWFKADGLALSRVALALPRFESLPP
jgi:hypothetical protein